MTSSQTKLFVSDQHRKFPFVDGKHETLEFQSKSSIGLRSLSETLVLTRRSLLLSAYRESSLKLRLGVLVVVRVGCLSEINPGHETLKSELIFSDSADCFDRCALLC